MSSSKPKRSRTILPVVIPPVHDDNTTMIILHGRGSTAEKFAEPSTDGTPPPSKSFQEHFPNTKFVFPTAPLQRAVVFKRSLTHQWFDNWSLTEPGLKQHLVCERRAPSTISPTPLLAPCPQKTTSTTSTQPATAPTTPSSSPPPANPTTPTSALGNPPSPTPSTAATPKMAYAGRAFRPAISPRNSATDRSMGVVALYAAFGDKGCCRDYPVERCEITPAETYVCWANDLDDNPMRKVEADVTSNAQSVRRILSEMSLTISSPTAGLVVSRAVVTSSDNNASMTPTTFASSSFTPSQAKGVKPSVWAIAGVAVAAAILLGLVILGTVLVLRRKKKRLVKAEPRYAQSGTLAGKTSANEFSDARAKYEVAG